MRLEQFFEKFELFADAPNAVARMRELVLELAIQGKLVSQDSADEPVLTALERIAAKKVKAGRVVRVNAGRPGTAAAEESATHVPSGWAKASLAELVTVLNGRAYAKDELLNSGTPVLRVGNLFTSKHWYYSDLALEADKYCDKGDLIFAWSASFGPFIWPGPEVIYHYHIWKLELHSEADLNKQYLYWFLQNKTQEIKRAGHGVSMLHMTKEKMEKLEVMVPPLAEQKRIVAKVDELMALCDRLEAQQQERDTRHAALARASLTRFAEAPTPANLDFLFHQSYPITPADLRKTILSLAVQGKLVHQDMDDESGQELLEKIDAERTRAINARLVSAMKPVPAVDSNELAYDVPSNWGVARLCQLVMELQTGPFGSSLHKSDYHRGGTPVINPASIKDGRIEAIEEMAIGKDTLKRLAGFKLIAGDIIMARRGEMGRCAVVTDKEESWLCGTGSLVLRMPKSLHAPFLAMLIGAPQAREYLGEASVGTTMQNLNQSILARMPVGVPPLTEQRRIVAKVDQLMAMIDQLEVQLAEDKAKSTALLDAVIHELLNPTAEIVDLAAYRAAIGCYVVRKMHDKPYFGRTAAMKLFYLAQAHVGLELDLRPLRDAAGPLDPWIYDFEREGARKDWFRVAEGNIGNGKTKIAYQPGRMLGEKSALAERLLSASQRKEYDRLLELFADRTTKEAEIIATLFAAWNDFLIDGHTPGGDQIVTEVREHWHEKKAWFTPTVLRQWLAWLRQNNLVPTGRLPHTVHQPQLLLN